MLCKSGPDNVYLLTEVDMAAQGTIVHFAFTWKMEMGVPGSLTPEELGIETMVFLPQGHMCPECECMIGL